MDRVIRVAVEGKQDPDRWIRVERMPTGAWRLEFFDLALPRRQRRFFSMPVDSTVLELALAGCDRHVAANGATCSIRSTENETRLSFRPSGWPFEAEWRVLRNDFVLAVISLCR